ncbi:MAG: hypothetical protein KA271_06120 [Propionivibrio sp.]|nr:hypothetical protein [Hydrogenophilales bacterium]MBP6422449.1 hypothetical protein [Propionivibrio sp.]
MAIQVLNKQEINEVSGGLSIAIGDNPILNGVLSLAPGGIFTLVGGLLQGLLNMLCGLRGCSN